MRHASLLILLIVLLYISPALTRVNAAPSRQEGAPPNVLLSKPVGGQALQGVVEIRGNTAVANFRSANLAFAYHDTTTGTWFLIHESDSPVAYDTLTQWDTTTITDGNYDLRLSIILTDGSTHAVIVEGLRVRNYTAIETDTPTPQPPTDTPLPATPGETSASLDAATSTPSPTLPSTATSTPVLPSLTPLPTNPAELSQTTILTTVGKGGLASLALFALLGIYIGGRAILRRPSIRPKR